MTCTYKQIALIQKKMQNIHRKPKLKNEKFHYRTALHDALSCQLPQSCAKNHFRKTCNRNDLENDSRSLELPRFDRPNFASCSNDSIWHCFWDITTLQCTAV